MTIQQLYDKALEEGALNDEVWLSGEDRERPLEETDISFECCLHYHTVDINTKMR